MNIEILKNFITMNNNDVEHSQSSNYQDASHSFIQQGEVSKNSNFIFPLGSVRGSIN